MPERVLSNIIEIKLIVIGLLAWAARLTFKTQLTVGLVVRQLVVSALVGVTAAQYVADSEPGDWFVIATYCAVVFLADDVLVLLLAFSEYVKSNQTALFKRFLSK